MSQEVIEPEVITEQYSPFDAPVKERAYTKHTINQGDNATILEEPSFQAPSFSDFEDVQEEPEKEKRVFNESYSELDGKEKTMGAEMMAEMTLDLYGKGCGLLGKLPEISESKLDRLMAEGEIDPDILLPTESGDIPIKEFAQEYNSSISEAFLVSDDFKEKVRPPLIRVFKKKGIGMTDEQLLAYYFISDLGTKGVQAVMLKKTANSILDSLKENTQARRAQYAPQPQQQTPQQPQRQQPIYQEPTATTAPEFTSDFARVIVEESEQNKSSHTSSLEDQIVTFSEPEEKTYDNVSGGVTGFTEKFVEPANMPNFGNEEALAHLEAVAKNAQSKKPTKAPVRKQSSKRTPRKK